MYGHHTLNIEWAILLYHPGVLIMMIGGASCVSMMILEFVGRVGRRNDLRQQMMYERQETVFYVSSSDKTLLRPAPTPPADLGNLLRSAEPAPTTPPTDMLRASGVAGSSTNTK